MYFTKSQDALNFFRNSIFFERLASDFFRNITLAYGVTIYFKGCRLPCPLESLQTDLSVVCKGFGHAVNEFGGILRRVSAGNCKDSQSNAKG